MLHVQTRPARSAGQAACEQPFAAAAASAGPGTNAALSALLDELCAAPGSSRESEPLRRLRAHHQPRPRSSAAIREGRPAHAGGRWAGLEQGVETELCWRGNLLVWSRGRHVVRTFTFEEDVAQACWAWIDTARIDGSEPAASAGPSKPTPAHTVLQTRNAISPAQRQLRRTPASAAEEAPQLSRALCVCLRRSLVLHFPATGAQHVVAIGFLAERMFPASVGLVIDRASERDDQTLTERSTNGAVQTPLRGKKRLSDGTEDDDLENASIASRLEAHGMGAEGDGAHPGDAESPLPSLFYLRRCNDEPGAVTRVQRITQAGDDTATVHGPASEFNELDERVVFVADTSRGREAPHPLIVTANHRRKCVRIYAFAHSAKPLQVGASDAAQRLTTVAESGPSQASGPSQLQSQMQTPAPPGIGRGRPPPRKSARKEAERRISGSQPRRYSSGVSMHSIARNGVGNSSQYGDELVDMLDAGHDSMLLSDDVGMRSSRVPSGPAAGTRLRRASHAVGAAGPSTARTPHGQRVASRQSQGGAPTTAARPSRTSMSQPARLSELGTIPGELENEGFSAPLPTLASQREHIFMPGPSASSTYHKKTAHPETHPDSVLFSQAFASMALLEEIDVPELDSLESSMAVSAFFLDSYQSEASLFYVHVPVAQKLLARELFVGGDRNASATLMTREPASARAASELAVRAAVPIACTGDLRADVALIDAASGALYLSIGAPGPLAATIPIALEGPLESVITWSEAEVLVCKRSAAAASQTAVSLDLRPRCALTSALLRTLRGVLPGAAVGALIAQWLARRRQPGSATTDWACLCETLGIARTQEERPLDAGQRLARTRSVQLRRPLGTARTAVKSAMDAGLLGDAENAAVLSVVHAMAQTARLDVLSRVHDFERLAELALGLSRRCGWHSWVDYWLRLAPQFATDQLPAGPQHQSASPERTPPDVVQQLLERMQGRRDETLCDMLALPTIAAGAMTPRFAQLDRIFAAFAEPSPAQLMQQQTFSGRPLTGSLLKCCAVVEAMLTHGLSSAGLALLPPLLALPLREAMRTCQLDPPAAWPRAAYELIDRPDLALQTIDAPLNIPSASLPRAFAADTSMSKTLPAGVSLHPVAGQIFNEDYRLRDVAEMLETRRAVHVLRPKLQDNATEQETKDSLSQTHHAAVERIKATSVGRAMLCMATRVFVPTSKVRLHRLVLDVQLSPPPEGVKYSEPRPDAAELEWPEFHNGVATALELSMQSVSLDSGWIFSHHTGDVSPREAGFLLGIGLLGQLSALGRVHMFRYLRPRSGGLAPVAILLGLGASLIGTGDVATRQLIAMHLPAFQPAGSLDLNLTMIEQATSLMSMGLLFMTSDHAWTAGRLLDQIGAAEVRAAQGNVSQREAYSLSAGLSLGLVMLAKGRRAEMRTTADRATITTLTALMHGPPAPLLHDDDEDDESRPRVDISTTAMPATIALGLIYLRSNRADMASLIQLPASEADLDVVRPDVLLVRVLARGLIMWDAIAPTSAWLDSSLPSFLQGHRPASLGEAAQLAYYNMRAGACFALALKYAGSADPVAQGIVMTELRAFAKEAAVRASTFFAKIRQHALCAGVELLGVSAAMIMAGTGDLELLKFLRIQHGRQDASVGYGAQMATHMALGLLFLGGGRFTLGTSDSAIAALVIALFPRFPGTAQDNRAHLQAFRHLWVLAVEPRVLVAQDVSTESLAILPLRIVTREGKEIDARAPTLLPTHDTIKSLATDSARYWPTALDVTGNASHARALLGSQTVFVKRRAGQLSYADDPHGRHALSTRATGLEALLADAWSTVMDDESLDELVDSFSSSREHAIFLERICAAPWHNEAPATRAARGFCLNALMTDLTLDQSGTLSTRLALAFDARQPAARLAFVRDMPLLSAVYGDFTRLFGERAPLLQRTFVDEAFASASSDITDALLSGAQTPLALALQAYARDGSMPGSEALQLALLLAAAEMPSHAELAALRHLATEARANTSAEACAAAVRSCVSSLREARRTSPDKPIHRTVHVEPVWSPLALDQIIAAWHL